MLHKVLITSICALSFVGCASVPMESESRSSLVKEFSPPEQGNSGLYIYRSGHLGSALKKDIWVDETCVGQSAPNVFFYTQVACDETHKISTESEFSPNDLVLKTECDKNYFLSQYIKLGVFVGGADIKEVSEEEGKQIISQLDMAKSGSCSSSYN